MKVKVYEDGLLKSGNFVKEKKWSKGKLQNLSKVFVDSHITEIKQNDLILNSTPENRLYHSRME